MESFVAIDFETANEHRSSACAVGLVKFNDGGEEQDRFSTLLHPHESVDYFSPINTWIHGITAEDVASSPTWDEVHPVVVDFIADLPLVAHNMAFDGYVLTDLDGIYSKDSLHNRRYCTVRIARKLFPNMPSRSLDDLFDHYFPSEFFTHHQAADDAWACGKIFTQMQHDHGIDHLAGLCPPTGPGAAKGKRSNSGREWIYVPAARAQLPELLERFEGSQSLQGHHVTFTGALETATRPTMQALVESLGGVAEKSTTKKTTILVVGIPNPASWCEGTSASKKLDKATKLRDAGAPITVMSEKDFLNFILDGKH